MQKTSKVRTHELLYLDHIIGNMRSIDDTFISEIPFPGYEGKQLFGCWARLATIMGSNNNAKNIPGSHPDLNPDFMLASQKGFVGTWGKWERVI